MKIIIAGGTGFIGKPLVQTLETQNHEIVLLTRDKDKQNKKTGQTHYLYWNPPQTGAPLSEIENADAIINLAGEPIAGKRWTATQKKKIEESRIGTTEAIVDAIKQAKTRPRVLINASAIGYYGSGDNPVSETDPPGNDFLAKVCKLWEAEALKVQETGTRLVKLRIGIVLEKNGGALQKMLPPFQAFIGGPLGSGRQWMSWIHREDVIGLILLALNTPSIEGALNAAAPCPVTMNEFASTLGKVLGRPSLGRVPGPVLKILLGEMSEMLLKGQRVLPHKALEAGYQFQYPKLEQALRACLKTS